MIWVTVLPHPTRGSMRRPVLVVALLMLLTLAAPALAAGTVLRTLSAGGFHSPWIANDGLM